MAVLFWVFAGVAVYVYLGYPILVSVLAGLFSKPVKKAAVTPSVSLLIAAYNEAHVIEQKIRNSLALDYPPESLEIVIASDGSTDGTAELASRFVDGHRVRVLVFPRNRGKISVLNDSVPQLRGAIVAFSDASSMLAPEALRLLVESFADPEVGGVSGVYKVRKQEQAHIGASEDFYWKYETFLKRQEGRLGSILGGHGSLYAIRKELYSFPPLNTINDDYVIALRVVQQGYRMAYEPRSIACEEAIEMSGFSRRVRINTGNVKQLREMKALLWPPRWLALFFFLSHKAGRVVVPACMLGALVTNALLLDRPGFVVLALVQAAFYLLAIAGAFYRLKPKAFRLPYYFSMINAAAFLAVFFALIGRRQIVWKRQ